MLNLLYSFIGIIFNNNLTWIDHINNLKLKLAKAVGISKRIFTSDTLKNIYFAIFHSNINYGYLLCGNCHHLFILQKKALGMITNSHYPAHIHIITNIFYNKQGQYTLWQTKQLSDKHYHPFATKCLIYDIPKIINNCSSMITEKIQTHSFTGYSYYVKQACLSNYNSECYICNI